MTEPWEQQWESAVEKGVLTHREWQILALRAGIGGEALSWVEVGKHVGVTGQRAHQIAKRACAKIEGAGWQELSIMFEGALFGRYRRRG